MKKDKFIIDQMDLDDIISNIRQEVSTLSRYRNNEGGTIVLITEKFYFRIESNLTATIITDLIEESRYQIIIVVGGGQHGLLGMSWGAEKSMLKKIRNIFLKYAKN
jgi:hypothetical protein